MFSKREFKGLDGLETDELRELKRQTDDIKKAAADILALNSKKKLTKNDRQELSDLREREQKSTRKLHQQIAEWQDRPRPANSSATTVTTATGKPIMQDPHARKAIRRLHRHLGLVKNSLQAQDSAWEERLASLVRAVRCALVDIGTADWREDHLWEPSQVDPLDLKGMRSSQRCLLSTYNI